MVVVAIVNLVINAAPGKREVEKGAIKERIAKRKRREEKGGASKAAQTRSALPTRRLWLLRVTFFPEPILFARVGFGRR